MVILRTILLYKGSIFFFFNDTATTEIYTLSLHDALPILLRLMFRVQLSDALFYFCMGKKEVYEYIDPRSADFSLCIEVPIKVHRMGFRYTEIPMRERPRAAGESKVHAMWDGIRILKTMIKLKLSGI